MSAAVRYWFEQAVNVAPADRPAFLQGNCNNEVVCAEVLSLIRYDAGGSEPPTAVRSAIGTVLGRHQPKPPVARVGAFELGRVLGSGGMGLVYEARRVDGEVQQLVAVKFAQVSPAANQEFRESVHRRFARERQMLASLRHPYIAGLIDAGATEDGIPYAVIEKVTGEPIDHYCDRCVATLADRIRLVIRLCDAVQFAHRNLVVHSDIKPDNVLVTEDGIPKLIDFGVASELADPAASSTLRAFTPSYASPEQCLGLPPTVATDVYGIGAVLYRLLTGAPPRQLGAESLDDAIRQISEGQVLRPSAIRPELKGDLENILLKALQRDPNRRYASVSDLAEDLKRYLARRPVLASPDSMFYRASRFVRRNWVAVAATAIVAAAMVMATAVSLQQRHAAVRRSVEMRRLAEKLLFEVHDEIGNALGGSRARAKLGEIAVEYLESLAGHQTRDPELAWELMNAYSRLAQSRGGAPSSLGDTKSASQLATKALALGAIVENAGPDDERLDKLFAAYDALAPIFAEAGRPAEQREAVDRMLQLAPRLQPLREAQALKRLAYSFDERNMPQQAAETWARALAVLRNLRDTAATRSETAAQLASTLVGYGRAQALAGDFNGAVSSLQESTGLLQGRAAAVPQGAKSARQLYWTYIALGDAFGSPVRFSMGRTADAVRQYQNAQTVAEKLMKADPANEMAKLDFARALSREGAAVAASQPAAALALLERAYDVAAHTSPNDYSGLESRFTCLTSSVPPLVQLGRFERARGYVSEARRLVKQMRMQRSAVDDKNLLEAETILLYATGHRWEALREVEKHLSLLPNDTRPVLNENFARIELLERLRAYSANLDTQTCAAASLQLVRIWTDLRAKYPGSMFIRRQAERARASQRNACDFRAQLPSAATRRE